MRTLTGSMFGVASSFVIAWMVSSGVAHAMQLQVNTNGSSPAKSTPAEELKKYRLKFVDAEAAQRILASIFEGKMKVSVEPESNSVLVQAAADTEFRILEKLLRALDDHTFVVTAQQPQATVGKDSLVSIQVPVNSPSVAQLREDYRLLEQQSLDLAQRLRSEKRDQKTPSDELGKKSLTELVERVFQVRQLLQRAELAENARRLEKIQQSLEARDGLKNQIVQRRIEELLTSNLDWQKSDLIESNPAVADTGKAESNGDVEIHPNATALNPQSQVYLVDNKEGSNSKSPVGASDLLRISPAQMRELLDDKARYVKSEMRKFDRFRAQIEKEGEEKWLDSLETAKSQLKWFQRDLQFALLQYDETIKYLEVAVDNIKQQIKIAEREHEVKTALFQRGSVSQLEVNASLARPRELQLELQRVESLLKLYRAAGDIPELAEVSKRSGSTLGFNIGDAKLGVPVWIEGKGGLTTTPGGYAIVSNDQVGLVAQILFSNIPDHENARLMLKVETPISVSNALKSRGVGETAWHSVREVSISNAEIQAAIDGKPFRKSYFLRPDGSMVEKDTSSDAANTEKDPLVATIELAVP